MTVFKTYNLKLDEVSYFKLREIETSLERISKNKLTKSEVISALIDNYEPYEKVYKKDDIVNLRMPYKEKTTSFLVMEDFYCKKDTKECLLKNINKLKEM